jgi:hypothetical protein
MDHENVCCSAVRSNNAKQRQSHQTTATMSHCEDVINSAALGPWMCLTCACCAHTDALVGRLWTAAQQRRMASGLRRLAICHCAASTRREAVVCSARDTHGEPPWAVKRIWQLHGLATSSCARAFAWCIRKCNRGSRPTTARCAAPTAPACPLF